MAWPWLAIVARNIPWTEVARRAPQIIAASSELLNKRNATARAETRRPDEADEIELARRIRSLEERAAEHARVVEQLAEQTRDLSEGMQVLAARLRLLSWTVAALILFAVFTVLFRL